MPTGTVVYPAGTPSDWAGVHGKPYITVSAKGISNGQSSIPNDGADFGPDTLLGATAPNQYGPPYTQTSGIQEAWNYARSFATTSTAFIPRVTLGPGEFDIHQPIYLKYSSPPPEAQNTSGNASAVYAPSIIGSGGINGQFNYVPGFTTIKCASDFPKGEYAIAYIVPDSAYFSGATNPQWVGGILRDFILDLNNVGAGIFLANWGNGIAERIAIRNRTVPSPTITAGLSSSQQSLQTGAFVYTTTNDSGEFSEFRFIQIRGGTGEDGFVLQSASGMEVFDHLWDSAGSQRYGFYLINGSCCNLFPAKLTNSESDVGGGWTGSVPSTNPTSPQSASIYVAAGGWEIDTMGTFIGAPQNSPFIFNLGGVIVRNSMLRADNVNSSANSYAWVIVTSANYTIVEDSTIWYNSQYNGIFTVTFADNISNTTQRFRNNGFKDDNSGSPAVPLFNINWGSNPPWNSIIDASDAMRLLGLSPSITNPPVSGTVYQNRNPAKIKILLPVYASTSGTAGSVSVAMGNNSAGTNPPTVPTLYTKYVNGSTSSSAPEIVELEVPAGWYYSFTGSGVTFGTATVLIA